MCVALRKEHGVTGLELQRTPARRVRRHMPLRTADVLEVRAAELGVTVPQLIAELAALDSTPRAADADEIAELDRRAATNTPGSRVPQARVVQWLRTWGTPGFRPWPGQ